MRFIAVLGNTVGAGYNYLDLLVSRFLFPIRYLVTKSDLRCFVALAGILPAGKDTSLLIGLTRLKGTKRTLYSAHRSDKLRRKMEHHD